MDNAIIGIAPFYIGVHKGSQAPVVTPRHNAIPRRGWVAKGAAVMRAIDAHNQLHRPVLECLRSVLATVFNGAIILRALAKQHGLLASPSAATKTLILMQDKLTQFSGGETSPPATMPAFHRGERISIRFSSNEFIANCTGEWFPGEVRTVRRDGTIWVKYVRRLTPMRRRAGVRILYSRI